MTEAAAPTPPPAARPLASQRTLRDRLAGRTAGRGLLALTALWIVGVSFGLQGWIWVDVPRQTEGPHWWVAASLLQALLIGAPVAVLSLRRRFPRLRGAYRGWGWAAAYLLVLAPTRWWPPVQGQTILLAQIVLTVIFWFIVRRFVDYRPPSTVKQPLLALGAGALIALPWLSGGAWGSWLDSALALALAAAVGRLAATLHLATWTPPQRRDPRRPRRDRLVGGLVLGVTLVILCSAVGYNGLQLWLMVGAPAAAWLAIAAGAPAWGIAAVLAAPLLLIDADAVNLVVADGALVASMGALIWSVLIAWGVGALSLWPEPDPHRALAAPVAWSAGLIGVSLAALVATTSSLPGQHGDRLFVVMAGAADLSDAQAIADVSVRREHLYRALTAHADASQAPLRAQLDRLGIGYTPYYLVNGLEVDAGLLLGWWLRTRPDVAEVLPSPVLRPLPAAASSPFDELLLGDDDTAPTEPPWNLRAIGADRVWRELGVTGAGIVIGQSDSGADFTHPELAATYRGRDGNHDANWFDPWYGTTAPTDTGGHGTHTLATVLGQQVGVAPDATWFACANLPRNLGSPAKYLACLQFMFAPFPLDGDPLRDGDPGRAAHVLNNSWGCPADFEGCSATLMTPAVQALRSGGIFVVASAGNEGPACSTLDSPLAIHEGVLTVGASDAAGNLAAFSSTGPVTVDGSGRVKPDLLAPGVDVLSAVPGGRYASWDGTSMAGPHLAGVVALMWSANPALIGDIDATEAILLETARPFTGTLEADSHAGDDACLAQTDLLVQPNVVAGYGIVDAFAAVQAAQALR